MVSHRQRLSKPLCERCDRLRVAAIWHALTDINELASQIEVASLAMPNGP